MALTLLVYLYLVSYGSSKCFVFFPNSANSIYLSLVENVDYLQSSHSTLYLNHIVLVILLNFNSEPVEYRHFR